MTTFVPFGSPGRRSRNDGSVTSPGAAPGFINANDARDVVRVAACANDVAVRRVVSRLGAVTAGACGATAAVLAGAAALTAVLSVGVADGGADLDEKIRGVKTMTSAIKAAASSVRLSMQWFGRSNGYG